MIPFTGTYKPEYHEDILVRVMAVDAELNYAMCLDLDGAEGELQNVLIVPIRSIAVYSDIVDEETARRAPE